MRILADSDSDLCVVVITLKVQFFTFLSLFSHNSPRGLGIEALLRIVYVKDRTWMVSSRASNFVDPDAE